MGRQSRAPSFWHKERGRRWDEGPLRCAYVCVSVCNRTTPLLSYCDTHIRPVTRGWVITAKIKWSHWSWRGRPFVSQPTRDGVKGNSENVFHSTGQFPVSTAWSPTGIWYQSQNKHLPNLNRTQYTTSGPVTTWLNCVRLVFWKR